MDAHDSDSDDLPPPDTLGVSKAGLNKRADELVAKANEERAVKLAAGPQSGGDGDKAAGDAERRKEDQLSEPNTNPKSANADAIDAIVVSDNSPPPSNDDTPKAERRKRRQHFERNTNPNSAEASDAIVVSDNSPPPSNDDTPKAVDRSHVPKRKRRTAAAAAPRKQQNAEAKDEVPELSMANDEDDDDWFSAVSTWIFATNPEAGNRDLSYMQRRNIVRNEMTKATLSIFVASLRDASPIDLADVCHDANQADHLAAIFGAQQRLFAADSSSEQSAGSVAADPEHASHFATLGKNLVKKNTTVVFGNGKLDKSEDKQEREAANITFLYIPQEEIVAKYGTDKETAQTSRRDANVFYFTYFHGLEESTKDDLTTYPDNIAFSIALKRAFAFFATRFGEGFLADVIMNKARERVCEMKDLYIDDLGSLKKWKKGWGKKQTALPKVTPFDTAVCALLHVLARRDRELCGMVGAFCDVRMNVQYVPQDSHKPQTVGARLTVYDDQLLVSCTTVQDTAIGENTAIDRCWPKLQHVHHFE